MPTGSFQQLSVDPSSKSLKKLKVRARKSSRLVPALASRVKNHKSSSETNFIRDFFSKKGVRHKINNSFFAAAVEVAQSEGVLFLKYWLKPFILKWKDQNNYQSCKLLLLQWLEAPSSNKNRHMKTAHGPWGLHQTSNLSCIHPYRNIKQIRASFQRSINEVQLSDWCGFESRPRHKVVGKKS